MFAKRTHARLVSRFVSLFAVAALAVTALGGCAESVAQPASVAGRSVARLDVSYEAPKTIEDRPRFAKVEAAPESHQVGTVQVPSSSHRRGDCGR